MNRFTDLIERVNSPGAFRNWHHPRQELNETSAGTIDLKHLSGSVERVWQYAKRLPAACKRDDQDAAIRASFAIMQNLYPVVEAIDSDAAKYLAQAVEALRR